MTNWAFWFMVAQTLLCWGAAVAFAFGKNYPIGWTWFCYGLANIGFAVIAFRS